MKFDLGDMRAEIGRTGIPKYILAAKCAVHPNRTWDPCSAGTSPCRPASRSGSCER